MLLGQTILHPLCSKSIPFISSKTVLPLMRQNHSKIHWSLYASFCCCGPCSSLFELRRNKKVEQILPKKDGMSPEKKAFGWEIWKISSNVSFQGFSGCYIFWVGVGKPIKTYRKNRLGILTATVVGVACQWPPPVRGGWVEGVGCYASKNNTPPKFNMEPEKKSLEARSEAPLGVSIMTSGSSR